MMLFLSRATDADRCQKPPVRLDSFRSPFGADNFVSEHQTFVAAGAGITEQIGQWLLPGHVKVFSVRKVDPSLHELCHVDLQGIGIWSST